MFVAKEESKYDISLPFFVDFIAWEKRRNKTEGKVHGSYFLLTSLVYSYVLIFLFLFYFLSFCLLVQGSVWNLRMEMERK